MLTPEQFDAWVAALRSGNYKQGKDALRKRDFPDGERYCCLGVLADTLGVDWRIPPEGSNTYLAYWPKFDYLNGAIVPHQVLDRCTHLTSMNDSGVWLGNGLVDVDFEYIAKYLEDNKKYYVNS